MPYNKYGKHFTYLFAIYILKSGSKCSFILNVCYIVIDLMNMRSETEYGSVPFPLQFYSSINPSR